MKTWKVKLKTHIPHSNYRGGNYSIWELGWLDSNHRPKKILASRQVVESHVPPNQLWSCLKSTVQGYKIKVTQTKKRKKRYKVTVVCCFLFVFFLRQLQARNSPPKNMRCWGGSRVPTNPQMVGLRLQEQLHLHQHHRFLSLPFQLFRGLPGKRKRPAKFSNLRRGVGLFDTKPFPFKFFWTPEIPRPKTSSFPKWKNCSSSKLPLPLPSRPRRIFVHQNTNQGRNREGKKNPHRFQRHLPVFLQELFEFF